MDKHDRQHLHAGTLVKLHLDTPALAEQCPHTTARGRYVIASDEGWLICDPGTKMQALIWRSGANGDSNKTRALRGRRIHWQCFECGEIMPLSNYDQ